MVSVIIVVIMFAAVVITTMIAMLVFIIPIIIDVVGVAVAVDNSYIQFLYSDASQQMQCLL